MTKLKTPLLALEAHGTIGDSHTYQRIGRFDIVRKKPVPRQPNSLAQMYHRWLYQDYCYIWSALSVADKQVWVVLARGTRLSGFQLYMSTKLATLPEISGMWHLDYQVGGESPDSSPHGNDGTVFGCITSPGHIHNSFYFDGVNDWVRVADDPAFDWTTALTVEVYCHSLLDDGTWRTLVSKWDTQTAAKRTFMLAQNVGGQIDWRCKGAAVDFLNTPPVLDSFYHLAGVFDAPSMHLYKQGELASSKVTAIGTLEQNDYPVVIGAQGDVRRFIKGYQDHVVLWNIALPPELIKVHSERRWPLQ